MYQNPVQSLKKNLFAGNIIGECFLISLYDKLIIVNFYRIFFILKRWLETYPSHFYESGKALELYTILNSFEECDGKTRLIQLFNDVIS